MGLFGLPFPEEYGGMGGDYFALCIALEELARVDSSVAITLEAGVSLGAMPIFRFGTEEQKREWLPRLCSGEMLGAFGLTEPGGGSDAGATRPRPGSEDGEWVINGTKAFITNSGTDITGWSRSPRSPGRPDATGQKEISAIIVPSGTPGFTVVEEVLQGRLERLGHPRAVVRRLPGAGGQPARRARAAATRSSCPILDEGRIAIAALGIGLAQGCVDESVKYAKERQAFGRPIGSYQAIQFKIADMEMRAHTVPAGVLRRGAG